MAVDDSYTKSLLHFDGSDASTTFTDESGKTWTAAGNAQIDTAQKKFGSASGLFDGTGDNITTPDSADFNVSNGDFTIDMWLRPAAINQDCYVCAQCDSVGADSSISWFIGLNTDESVRGGIVTSSTYKTATSTASQYAANTWVHIALVRNGNTITLYINGTANGTVDVTGVTANNSAYKAAIGGLGEYTDALMYNGWVDEFRFSLGIARWTANFTPPTAAYRLSNTGFFF